MAFQNKVNIERAIAAARGQLRHSGVNPSTCSAGEAEAVLDDLGRIGIEAGIWFRNASDNQVKMFRKEWKKWRSK